MSVLVNYTMVHHLQLGVRFENDCAKDIMDDAAFSDYLRTGSRETLNEYF